LAACGPGVDNQGAVQPDPVTDSPETAPAPAPVEMSADEMSSRLRLALARNREAEWRAALVHLELLREQQPTSWIVQLEFAWSTYRTNGDLDTVRDALEAALELNDTNPRAWVMMGQLHEDQGEDAVAEEYYRKGIALREN